jgi:hypothetical protein
MTSFITVAVKDYSGSGSGMVSGIGSFSGIGSLSGGILMGSVSGRTGTSGSGGNGSIPGFSLGAFFIAVWFFILYNFNPLSTWVRDLNKQLKNGLI